jgi:hypothetical protein
MTKPTTLSRPSGSREAFSLCFLLTILLILVVSPAWALTTYYVDPNWTGSQTGAAATPWTSPVWATINTALASDNVTVYFAATRTTTTGLTVSRTEASTRVLTLDGISQYNTTTAPTTPSWATNVVPSPSNYQAASKFEIIARLPLDGGGSVSNCRPGVTIMGFKVVSTGGQIATLHYVNNLVLQYSELTASAGTIGPGLIFGPGNQGPGCGGSGPNNIQVLNNYIHDTYGECIYIGASTSDPSTPAGGAQATGDNYLVQGNQIQGCAARGGQGDGIDIKDGHTNLRIVNNVIKATLGSPGNDGQGMSVESGTLIDGNYIEAPDHNCIAVFDGWHNSVGRSGLTIQNNVCVNVTSGNGHNNGIELFDVVSAAWTFVRVLNNTIHNISPVYKCVAVGSGHRATVYNNIFSNCGGGGLGASSGTLGEHDYNLYFGTGSSSISYSGTFACASVASFETHSLCGDPLFVSTSTPYAATNFKLRTGSPAIARGLNLSAMFTRDYAGAARLVPWDMGAFNTLTGIPPGGVPRPPSGLLLQ